MARSGDDEYAGTEAGTGDAISIVDPANIGGGGDGGNLSGSDGGNPAGSGSGDDDDPYQRNPDGSVKLNQDGSPRRKRKRRGTGEGSGGSRASGKAKAPVSVNAIEGLLYSTHMMLAAVIKTPEIALEKSESKTLAAAIADVSQYYPNAIFTDKQMAILNLGLCTVTVYGPRIYMVRNRLARERRQERANIKPAPINPVANHPQAEAAQAMHAATDEQKAAPIVTQYHAPGMPGYIGPVETASF